jgi:hypothetical protein
MWEDEWVLGEEERQREEEKNEEEKQGQNETHCVQCK